MLITVAHFHKEVFGTFGIPFLLRIHQVRLSTMCQNVHPPIPFGLMLLIWFPAWRADSGLLGIVPLGPGGCRGATQGERALVSFPRL